MTKRIALINAGYVTNVIVAGDEFLQTIQDNHDEFVELPEGSMVAPDWTYDGTAFGVATTRLGPDGTRVPLHVHQPEQLPEPPKTRMTKDAFQARFPKSADGVSTKFDLLMLFLSDPAYSEFCVPDATARFGLKALVMAGKNKLDSSKSVDLSLPDAAMFTGLLVQVSIPAAFRLTGAERTAILKLPLADAEVFK